MTTTTLYRKKHGLGLDTVHVVWHLAQVRMKNQLRASSDKDVHDMVRRQAERFDAGHVGQGRRNYHKGKLGMPTGADAHPVAMLRRAEDAVVQMCVTGDARTAGDRRGIGAGGKRGSFVNPNDRWTVDSDGRKVPGRSKKWGRALSQAVRDEHEQEQMDRVRELALQGAYVTDAAAEAISADLQFLRMAWGADAALLKFLLNAVSLTCPTPGNLVRWGYTTTEDADGKCALCGKRAATLWHILCGCPYYAKECDFLKKQGNIHALTRPGWRHDNILRRIVNMLTTLLEDVNKQATIYEIKAGAVVNVALMQEPGTKWGWRQTFKHGGATPTVKREMQRAQVGVRLVYTIGGMQKGTARLQFDCWKDGLKVDVRKVVLHVQQEVQHFVQEGATNEDQAKAAKLNAQARRVVEPKRGGVLMAGGRDWRCTSDMPEFNQATEGKFVFPQGILDGTTTLKPELKGGAARHHRGAECRVGVVSGIVAHDEDHQVRDGTGGVGGEGGVAHDSTGVGDRVQGDGERTSASGNAVAGLEESGDKATDA